MLGQLGKRECESDLEFAMRVSSLGFRSAIEVVGVNQDLAPDEPSLR